ncbi:MULTISPECIES: restriction endonuclease subunit S [Aeromonas]|nr:restriction endonuclease subunit S [Aeromonas hydrophila]
MMLTAMPKYDTYKDSGVEWLGDIPHDWKLISLKRTIVGCVNGLWGKDPNSTNDIIVLRVADFERNKLKINDKKLTVRSIPLKDRCWRLLKKGDLLIEKSGGGDKTLVGCVVLFDKDYDAITSNFVAKMTPKDKFDARFLCYLFSALYSSDVNYRSIKQTTGIQNLDSDAYLSEVAAFPLWRTQVAIANFLDQKTTQIDEAIAIKEQQIALLNERKQILIQQAVTQGLDPTVPMKDSGVAWIGKIPDHWKIEKSRWLFKQRKSLANKNDEQLTASQKYGVISQKKFMELEGRRVTQVELNHEILKHVEANDFVISMRSFQGGIEYSPYSGCVSSAYVPLIPSDAVYAPYFKYLLKSNRYIEALQSTSNLVRDGQALRYENFCMVDLLVVPMEEQIAIAEFINNQLDVCEQSIILMEAQIDGLKEYKTTLINSAVTGKIKVM